MLATNSPSAGVYSIENDRSQRLTALSTSIGAVVGASNRGPVGKRTLLTDNDDRFRIFGKKDPRVGYAHYCADTFLKQANRLYFTRVAIEAKYGGIIVTTDNNYSTTRPLGQGFDNPAAVSLSNEDIMLIYGANEGEWNNDVYVIFYPDVNDPDNQAFILEVYEGDSTVAVERYTCTTFEKVDETGAQLFVETVVNQRSDYIRIRFNPNHVDLTDSPEAILMNALGGGRRDPLNPNLPNGQLSGGDNGKPVDINNPDPAVANAAVAAFIEAWELYEDWEEVQANILINAGLTHPAIQYKMDEIANARQDCVAVLDLPSSKQKVQDAIDFRRGVTPHYGLQFNLNSSWSAMYGPDLKIRDTENGMDVWVPASGHVAAVMALTDRVDGTWFAPAGLQRGILDDVIELRETYDLGERNMMVDNQINVVRNIQGRGIVLWGADTMQAMKSALTDLGVRRMLCMLHASVRINNLWAPFQPNDDILRTRQRISMEDLLRPVRQGRGLDWFEVICDERNNGNAEIANGDVIVDVYLDPTVHTKRIHLNAIIPRTGEAQFAAQLIDRQ